MRCLELDLPWKLIPEVFVPTVKSLIIINLREQTARDFDEDTHDCEMDELDTWAILDHSAEDRGGEEGQFDPKWLGERRGLATNGEARQ
ncbi:hypothetical protein J6590_026983 [Homalodisca vitripennis]|nr:hypothetical protein J6590_026983 [Homalodisca vitripennis]